MSFTSFAWRRNHNTLRPKTGFSCILPREKPQPKDDISILNRPLDRRFLFNDTKASPYPGDDETLNKIVPDLNYLITDFFALYCLEKERSTALQNN